MKMSNLYEPSPQYKIGLFSLLFLLLLLRESTYISRLHYKILIRLCVCVFVYLFIAIVFFTDPLETFEGPHNLVYCSG